MKRPPLTRWERVAQTRWGAYVTEVERQAFRAALDACHADHTALEVGCEGGRWSSELVAAGWDVTCSDVDPFTLEVCRRRLPTARCISVAAADVALWPSNR